MNMVKKNLNIPDEGGVDASQAELGREKPSEEHGVTSVEGECTGGSHLRRKFI